MGERLSWLRMRRILSVAFRMAAIRSEWGNMKREYLEEAVASDAQLAIAGSHAGHSDERC